MKAAAVSTSNCVSGSSEVASTTDAAASTRSTAAVSAASPRGAPPTCTRSRKPCTWGEMYAPAASPCASRMAAANSVVDVFPVRAHDVEGAEPPLRLAELREQRAHPLETEPHAERGTRGEQVLEPGHVR